MSNYQLQITNHPLLIGNCSFVICHLTAPAHCASTESIFSRTSARASNRAVPRIKSSSYFPFQGRGGAESGARRCVGGAFLPGLGQCFFGHKQPLPLVTFA